MWRTKRYPFLPFVIAVWCAVCVLTDVCVDLQRMLDLEKKAGLAVMVSPAGARSLNPASVHAGAPRALMPWMDLDPTTASKYFSSLAMPIFRDLLALAGSRRDADVLFAHALRSHSEMRRSQSVTTEECIFCDPLSIVHLAGLDVDIEKALKYKIKNEQSAYEFMIFLENNGIGTRAAAKLRIDKPGLFHGSGKVTGERNFEKEMVHELLGAPIEIIGWHAPLKVGEEGILGYMWDTVKCATLLAKRSIVAQMQPSDDGVDLDQMEADSRSGIQEQLKSMKGREGTPYFVKKEAELKNLSLEVKKARRRCNYKGINLTVKKEKCVSKLCHRQTDLFNKSECEAVVVWLKIGFDGRVLLRQLTSSIHSNQFAAMMNVVNDGSQVQSIKNTFAWAYTIGGEKSCWPVLKRIMEALAGLRTDGIQLGKSEMADFIPMLLKEEAVYIGGVEFKFRFTFTVDAACMYKFVLGPCGYSPHTPCPSCGVICGNNTGEGNINYAMVMSEVIKGETPWEFFTRNGISEDTGRWVNEKGMHHLMKVVTGKGSDSIDEDHRSPWVGLTKFTAHEPMVWAGHSKKYLRGRMFWEQTRDLRPEIADYGWKWSDFVMCVCHEPMRDVEWKLYCLFGYTKTRSLEEINDWLAARNTGLQIKEENDKLLKPVLNYGSQVDKWFAKDPLDDSKYLWESAIDYVDEGREDTKDIWLSYIALNEIMQEPYPTHEMRLAFAPRSFDYFLRYVLRYQSIDVGHYLHQIFAHGTEMIMKHLSLALHKNEGLEGVNSEDKSQQQNHGRHGGCGTNMCFECLDYAGRKLVRHCRGATSAVPHFGCASNTKLCRVVEAQILSGSQVA